MKCGIGLCGHCQLGPLLLCRDGPVVGYAAGRATADRPGVVMSKPVPRRVEARVLRRLPADPARLRGRAARAGRRGDHRAFPRGVVGHGARALRHLAGRGVRHHRPRRAADPRDPPGSRGRWSPSARARPPAGSRRCATSGTWPSSPPRSTPARQYIDTLATSTPVAAHVPVDFELRGCPIDRRQLLEVLTALLAGRKPDIPDTSVCTECKRRGPHVRDGRRRHPVPRAGHPRRVRRAVPRLRPRLLRLLRPGERTRTCPP